MRSHIHKHAQHTHTHKQPDVAALYAQTDWAGLAAQGKLTSLTNPTLKAYLASNRLPVSGNKADLIARIESHLARTRQPQR